MHMPRTYHLNIEGVIGDWITGATVRTALRPHAGKEINVRISSYGGALKDGLDICTQFREHGGVTAYIHGCTASAATVLAMGAQRIVMAPEAVMLIHNASMLIFEYEFADKTKVREKIGDFEHLHADLATFDAVMARLYAARTGKTEAEMAALMEENRWITAQEALEYGLIDEIDSPEEAAESESAENRVVAYCKAHGLPAPPLRIVSEPSLMQKALDFIKGHARNPHVKSKNKRIIMDKTTHPALLQALGVDQIEAGEKGFSLSNAQGDALDKALAEAQKVERQNTERVQALEKENQTLKNTISALEEEQRHADKADGAQTEAVTDTADKKEEDPVLNAAANAKNILGKIQGIL